MKEFLKINQTLKNKEGLKGFPDELMANNSISIPNSDKSLKMRRGKRGNYEKGKCL